MHHAEYPERDEKGTFDPYLVQFDEGDPANPKVRGRLVFIPAFRLTDLQTELVKSAKMVFDNAIRSSGSQRVGSSKFHPNIFNPNILTLALCRTFSSSARGS